MHHHIYQTERSHFLPHIKLRYCLFSTKRLYYGYSLDGSKIANVGNLGVEDCKLSSSILLVVEQIIGTNKILKPFRRNRKNKVESKLQVAFQVNWTLIFILPKDVIRIIEQKFNRFMWNGNELSSAKVKVAWDFLCVPKDGGGGGGLGLIKLVDWNRAAILYPIWSLFARSRSLWVLGFIPI